MLIVGELIIIIWNSFHEEMPVNDVICFGAQFFI
jgi:hypothetical protein